MTLQSQDLQIKDISNSKSVQEKTKEHFLHDLGKGVYQPGQKIPGDRDLARLYGIGRSSMAAVLKELQKDRYIERIPIRGTFIRRDVNMRVQPIKLILASPERSLSATVFDMFAWENISELVRGFFDETSRSPGVSLTWHCCVPTTNRMLLKQQFEDIYEADGVIFMGSEMVELKELFLQTGKPALVVAPHRRYRVERYPSIDFDRERILMKYAEHLGKFYKGKEIVIFRHLSHEEDKAEDEAARRNFLRELSLNNIPFQEWLYNTMAASYSNTLELFKAHLKDIAACRGKVILAANRSFVFPLQSILLHEEDIQLAGFFGGYNMRNLHPEILYIHEPYFEIGQRAVELLTASVRDNQPFSDLLVEPTIYHGEHAISQKTINI